MAELMYRRYVYPTFTNRINEFFSQARMIDRITDRERRLKVGQNILYVACGVFIDINYDLLREDIEGHALSLPRPPYNNDNELYGVELRQFVRGAISSIDDFNVFIEFIEKNLLAHNGIKPHACEQITDLCRSVRLAPLRELQRFDFGTYLKNLENLGNTICNLKWEEPLNFREKVKVLSKAVSRGATQVANLTFSIHAPFLGGLSGLLSNAVAEQIVSVSEVKSTFVNMKSPNKRKSLS